MGIPESESADDLLEAIDATKSSMRPRAKSDSAGRDYATFAAPLHAPKPPRVESMDLPSVLVADGIGLRELADDEDRSDADDTLEITWPSIEAESSTVVDDVAGAGPSTPPVAHDIDARETTSEGSRRPSSLRLDILIGFAGALSAVLLAVAFFSVQRRTEGASSVREVIDVHERVSERWADGARMRPRRPLSVSDSLAPAPEKASGSFRPHRPQPRSKFRSAESVVTPSPSLDLLENEFPH